MAKTDPKDLISFPLEDDAATAPPAQEVLPARIHQVKSAVDSKGSEWKFPKVDLDEVEAMACVGLTQMQMAEALHINPSVFGRMVKNDPVLTEAIDRGKARGAKMIADALFANAMKGNVAAQIFSAKARLGWSDKQEIDLKTTHEVKMSFEDAVEALKAAGIDPSKV